MIYDLLNPDSKATLNRRLAISTTNAEKVEAIVDVLYAEYGDIEFTRCSECKGLILNGEVAEHQQVCESFIQADLDKKAYDSNLKDTWPC